MTETTHTPGWTIPGYLEIRNNHLHVNGTDAAALAERYDTPLFVISAPRVRDNIARLAEVSRKHSRVKLCYASKANTLLAVLRLVRDSGIDIEVNSGGELFRALHVGFRPEQIIFNGTSKTDGEITQAVTAGIYSINVDSPFELEAIEKVAAREGKRARVTLRLVPDVGTRSHLGLQTALYTSKFGISPARVRDTLVRALKHPELIELVGIHIHVGSQTPDVEPYAEAFSTLWEHLVWLHDTTGHRLTHINIGGGIPVNYLRDASQAGEISEKERDMLQAQLSAADMLDGAMAVVRDTAHKADALHLLENLEILLEPGRSVIADAVTLLTTVRNIKERPETGDTWLLTDAGYNLMLSMVMYNWYYHAASASRAGEPHSARYKMAGPLCDGGDVYFDLYGDGHLPDYRLLPPDVAVGEVVAMFNTGAYTMSQMTAYNGRPMPAAVVVEADGSHMLARKRDTYEDLLLNEI